MPLVWFYKIPGKPVLLKQLNVFIFNAKQSFSVQVFAALSFGKKNP